MSINILEQKLLGVFEIIVSLVVYWITEDATMAVMMIPFGIFLILTRKQFMDF